MRRTKMFLLHSCPEWSLKQGQVRSEIFKMQTLPDFTQQLRSGRVGPSLLQIGFQFINRQLYIHEIDSPAHWNPTGRTKSALPVVISPSSILQPASSPHCVFIHSHKKISGALFKRFIVSFFFTFLKLSESVIV